ncbi:MULTISPECIES: hypothetical protein [unclassified Streptomyces]|uniref:hypothetical protein n=1 Tax=unclassified Streptomyces TaxID=2593676 RepID=UPI002E2A6D10|nr:hypothetical protein [Streptomyces sp. NBC_00190]
MFTPPLGSFPTVNRITVPFVIAPGSPPGQPWLPPSAGYHCQYVATRVATKLRWDLAADEAERQALLALQDCPDTTVVYEPAP